LEKLPVLEAAVALPIVLDQEPYTIFVRRSQHMRRNPGQIAFPGGLIEPGESPEQAALRECSEEIGIDAASLTVVGRLEAAKTLALGVRIVPIVATLRPPVRPRPDGVEIDAIFEVPLAAIFAPGALRAGREPFRGLQVRSWLFDHGEMHVWGATARILRAFVDRYGPDGAVFTQSGPWAGPRK
jgi:8-oxo-dGTP pyrophosphatase MutT (NUDIX family)